MNNYEVVKESFSRCRISIEFYAAFIESQWRKYMQEAIDIILANY